MKPLVIYHGNCPDGFTAAWVAARALERIYGEVELFPGEYGKEPPYELARNRQTYVVDFSYPREQLERLASEASWLTLLDHHRTAERDLSGAIAELEGVCQVKLADGSVAFVDAADLERVAPYSWSRQQHGGAIAYAGGGRAAPRYVYMHRLIVDAPDGILVDHRNRNDLDNRRANLRLATKQQNAANMDRGSEWKGVTPHGERWKAQIAVAGEGKHLGVFDSAEEAARAYDTAAREHFGEFALTNFDRAPLPFPANATITFDMDRSGAGITWDYFHPGESRPWIVDYVEDRDLWRFKLPNSEELSLFIRTAPHDLVVWDGMAQMQVSTAIEMAEGCKRYLDHYVRDALRQAYTFEMNWSDPDEPDDWKALRSTPTVAVNVSYTGVSDVLNAALDAHSVPVALGWHLAADGTLSCSLRSVKSFDCSKIARVRGGGGHAQASGFRLQIDHPLAQELLHPKK